MTCAERLMPRQANPNRKLHSNPRRSSLSHISKDHPTPIPPVPCDCVSVADNRHNNTSPLAFVVVLLRISDSIRASKQANKASMGRESRLTFQHAVSTLRPAMIAPALLPQYNAPPLQMASKRNGCHWPFSIVSCNQKVLPPSTNRQLGSQSDRQDCPD